MIGRNFAYVFALMFLLILLSAPSVSAQETRDTDWLPDQKLNYTYIWPADPSRWSVSGRSMYELSVSVEEEVRVDFNFTYTVNQDANIDVWIFNKMPIGMFDEPGGFKGWLVQFDFVNPPTSNIGTVRLLTRGPLEGSGYEWSQPMKGGDQLVIKGRLVMVDTTAADLSAQGLASGWARLHYSNSYMPVADAILMGNQTLVPSMDIWGTLGIPISKSTIDIIRAMEQQETSFSQEKTKLQAQASDLQNKLSSAQQQVEILQGDLKSAQDKVSSLEKDNSALKSQVSSLESQVEKLQSDLKSTQDSIKPLQSEVSSKQSKINSLESQLSQSQFMFYGSAGAAVGLLIVAVVLTMRKRGKTEKGNIPGGLQV